ncbi:hypothetical protein LBMAG42_47500 [Deltaproteobacteria bacterium]|nr:hypothetical protein LBMAG42_47500 [Deltaproteobacteria bacterium]
MSPFPLLLVGLALVACEEQGAVGTVGVTDTDSATIAAADPIRIAELMFEPRRAEPREKFDGANWGSYTEIDEDRALEYVELVNAGVEVVDLSGWTLSDGIDYAFPAGARLEAGAYVVVAADPEAFTAYHGIDAVGPFTGSLKNGGETLVLTDASGAVADAVSWASLPPWPVRPGTMGASIERVSIQDGPSTVEGWRSSTAVLSEPLVGTGTPGAANSVAGEQPPFIAELSHSPTIAVPGGTVTITARVTSTAPLSAVEVEITPNGGSSSFQEMNDDGGHGDGERGDGVYGAVVTAGAEGSVTHYRVHAETEGLSSVYPYDDEPSPTRAFAATAITGDRPLWHLLLRSEDIETLHAAASSSPREDPEVDGTLVVDGVVYPHIRVSLGGRWNRANAPYAWHIALNPDAPLDGATSLHTSPYSADTQQAVFEAFDRVLDPSLPSELVDIQVASDGTDGGTTTYVACEAPNGRWLDRQGYGEGTEVYKARSVESASPRRNSDLFWFGDLGAESADNGLQTDENLWGAWKKGERALDPPDALRELIAALNDLPDAELLPWLAAHVDVEQWFTSIALHVYLRLDDFAGHNYYLLLPGDPGARWQILSYDFDAFGRFPVLPMLYATGLRSDENPNWQRNMLHRRIAGSPTLTRVYSLYVRRLIEAYPPETLMPGSLTSPVTEARASLLAELSAANLPSLELAPVADPCGGSAPGRVTISAAPGWIAYATLDGSDPRLSATRVQVDAGVEVNEAAVLRFAAVEDGYPIEDGRWTDDVECEFTGP